jgi:plastocyanin
MRTLSRLTATALLVAVALGPAPSSPALVATAEVTIQDSFFTPASVSISIGGQVRWTNQGSLVHTATSNQGFFNTQDLGNGAQAARTFLDAGSFAYHCARHPHMTGAVKARMTKAGSPAEGWRVRWSTRSATPDNRGYDVQIKRPGSSSFEAFRTNTQTRGVNFDPSRAGTYVFRARTDNRANGQSSGFSPTLSVVIS